VNAFVYVGNNPANLVDRHGLQPEEPPDDSDDPEGPDNPSNPYGLNPALQPSQPPKNVAGAPTLPDLTGAIPRIRGLPPSGIEPPTPRVCSVGPASRPSETAKGGMSLWTPNGEEWRYSPEDDWHNPHWDFNPWDSGPNTPWQNIPIGGLPILK